jgi:cytoskeletal protein RodZ
MHSTAVRPPAPDARQTQPGPSSSPAWQPSQSSQPPDVRRSSSLAAAIIVLALAVGGAAVAIVLNRQNTDGTPLVTDSSAAQSSTVTSVTTPTATSTETAPQEVASTPTTSSTEGALPSVPSEQMTSEIQQMLLAWHEDVVHGDYRAAWELLSRRKQVQDENEYGYATWVKNQSTLDPYLNPAGLQVSIEKTEPDEGVAQVDVTGMSWDKPGASCTEWSGITWVKYEDGAWKYDPGYSTTPQREHEWKPRYSELLGGRC